MYRTNSVGAPAMAGTCTVTECRGTIIQCDPFGLGWWDAVMLWIQIVQGIDDTGRDTLIA